MRPSNRLKLNSLWRADGLHAFAYSTLNSKKMKKAKEKKKKKKKKKNLLTMLTKG